MVEPARPTAVGGGPKPVRWIASSKADLSEFPKEVRRGWVGVALWQAQTGGKAPYAKPLKGYSGAGVLEVVDDFDGDISGPSTPCGSPWRSTSCMPSRRSRSRALRRQRRKPT